MIKYKTKIFDTSQKSLEHAAELIKSGEVVAIPTETVYGLAADALSPKSVLKIFNAKGRPSDNPLIVHIAKIESISELADYVVQPAWDIAATFFPAPLTMILPKKGSVPDIVSGGLDTVGIRMPDNFAALEIIRKSGCFLAAPSANRSGYPSPTSAHHVMADMDGRIPAIVDGGPCRLGVESTVICFEGKNIRILRPGFVTSADLKKFADKVIIDDTATNSLKDGLAAISPGIKYKHYSPRADVYLVEGSIKSLAKLARSKGKGAYYLIFDEDEKHFEYPHLCYGNTPKENAAQLFSRLREIDEIGADEVFVRVPDQNGIGLAVFNRLVRAAGFRIISVD